jgi:hypothetical protein
MRRFFASLLLLAFGQANEDDYVKTIHGERNNRDENGNFMHPFLRLPNTHLLLYPNIGAFSVRLTQHE